MSMHDIYDLINEATKNMGSHAAAIRKCQILEAALSESMIENNKTGKAHAVAYAKERAASLAAGDREMGLAS